MIDFKYTPTHRSNFDDSEVMCVSANPPVFMNEAGDVWLEDSPGDWEALAPTTQADPSSGPRSHDDYTDQVTMLRIYWEDYSDEFGWTIDGLGPGNKYTEDMDRYATLAEVLAVVPEWAKRHNLEPEREWVPATLHQIRLYLQNGWGVGSITEGQRAITEVRETEHGVEYR